MGHRCCSKQKIKRGLWSPEEDEKLMKYITTHGHNSWSSVPKFAGLQRCGKSCRLRWINYLRPDLKRGSFTAEEEQIIIDIHRILGNRWAQIAKHLPGRTDNEVKNFWNSCIKKKLISQGLDPQTHTLLASHRRTSSANCTISTTNIHQNSNSIFIISTSSSHTPNNNNAPIIETSQNFPSSLPNKSQQQQPNVIQTPSSIVNSSEYHHNNKFSNFTYEPSSIENNHNCPNIICSASCMNPSGVGVLWDSRAYDGEEFGVQRLEEEERIMQELQVQQQLEKEKNCEKGIIIDEMREANNNNYYDKGNNLETNGSTLESSNNFDFGLLESVLNSEFMSHDDINYMDELAWNF